MAAVVVFDDLPPAPPRLDRPAIEQARLVRLARDHLASTELSVDYDGLATGRDTTVLAARQWVKRQRGASRLFVVDHGGGTLIPTFQLDDVFDLDTRVAPAVARLADFGMSGWAMWQWFCAHNPWIDARPIDVIGQPDLDTELRGLVGD